MKALLKKIFEDLKKGTQLPKHPYRYCCLSSIKNNTPQQRMVVLRNIFENTITIYTDVRTPKVAQLTANTNASILFYDHKKMKQIQLTGIVSIEKEYDKSVWNSISPKAKKDYTTIKAPGTSIEQPDAVEYGEDINFCILKFEFYQIDYLSIQRPNHIRAKFEWENNSWTGSYQVP